MFIPLEGENTVCLENVVAIYREGCETVILKRGGKEIKSSFTPPVLAKKARAFTEAGLYKRKQA